ncbi:MAG: hypothetical protein K2H19_10060 [Ruminococcus sp.]|nr:hypothetical protein [Ruminococcus sp.]
MKKVIFLTISAILLTSCGTEKNPEDYVRAENFVVVTSTILPKTAINDEETETKAVEKKNIGYSLKDKDIELIVDGKIVQTIKCEYVPDEKQIKVADFNFDGYDDIFIPYENFSSSKTFGDYYCYSDIENRFTKNSELSKIGKILTVADEGILYEKQYDPYTDYVIEYKWTDGKLNPFRKIEKYRSAEDGILHTYVYKYTEDGKEYLEKSTP